MDWNETDHFIPLLIMDEHEIMDCKAVELNRIRDQVYGFAKEHCVSTYMPLKDTIICLTIFSFFSDQTGGCEQILCKASIYIHYEPATFTE